MCLILLIVLLLLFSIFVFVFGDTYEWYVLISAFFLSFSSQEDIAKMFLLIILVEFNIKKAWYCKIIAL